jgi:hypothetical protein
MASVTPSPGPSTLSAPALEASGGPFHFQGNTMPEKQRNGARTEKSRLRRTPFRFDYQRKLANCLSEQLVSLFAFASEQEPSVSLFTGLHSMNSQNPT